MSTIVQHELILAGRREPGGAEPIDVVFPYTGEVVARVAAASRADVERAIEAAQEAFRLYREEPAHRRSALLHAISAKIAERREELVRDITYETGKAIWESRLECDRAVTTFRIAGEEATRIEGEIVPLDGVPAGQGRLGEVRRFPIGPVAAITPFNSPFNLVAHKVAPALAAGNTIVVKPASTTPLSGLNVGALVTEAAAELGLPSGLISVLPCAPDAAEPLVTDPRIRGLSFTGSSPVGWALRARAGRKKVSLELGGNGAVIVHHDGDVALAAERVAFGGYLLAGQVCSSVQRVYVHEDVADAFTTALLERTAAIRVGDPFDEETTMGPMLTEEAAEKAERWLGEAVEGGARIVAGGTREGALFQPTVITGTRPEMRVACEEIFAPVVVVEQYSDLDDALVAANATEYGLQAGIFSSDLQVVHKAYRELEVGGVIVNDVNIWRVDSMPYGGVKSSGYGREGLRYAIHEQTEPKLLVLNLDYRPGA
jgi:acyl-CoA reductase-like NAD-dependent aldehyde dehydrogenase